MNEKDIQEMINNGELGVMTECAYGSAVADTEKDNNLKIRRDNMNEKESGY